MSERSTPEFFCPNCGRDSWRYNEFGKFWGASCDGCELGVILSTADENADRPNVDLDDLPDDGSSHGIVGGG